MHALTPTSVAELAAVSKYHHHTFILITKLTTTKKETTIAHLFEHYGQTRKQRHGYGRQNKLIHCPTRVETPTSTYACMYDAWCFCGVFVCLCVGVLFCTRYILASNGWLFSTCVCVRWMSWKINVCVFILFEDIVRTGVWGNR